MLPEIELRADIDVVALSPLLRGMVLTVSYAQTQGGLTLTASGAMNRKFVNWAAVHFDWPGYTAPDLYAISKVLNEASMPPLLVVHDMLKHHRLVRRRKDLLVPTQSGRDFLAKPQAFFDVIAMDYLYGYVHYWQTPQSVQDRMRWWHVFLELINIKTAKGCSLEAVVNELYPSESYPEPAEMTIEAWTEKSAFRSDVMRPLCWLGLLYEDREGRTIWEDGTYHQTPLWAAWLKLNSDLQPKSILQ